MFCPNCGSEVEDGSKFCRSCGFKLDQQNNSRENNEKQIDHSNNKKIDTQNKTSKKVIKKSKFPIFLIIFIVFVIGILGLFYFVIKENPINYVMDKINDGQFILFGSKSNERNLSDKINDANGVAVNGYVQKIDGFSIDDFDTVTFGTYPQDDVTGNSKEPIEWIVLDKVGDKALLMSKKVLDKKPFCNTNRHSNWEESDLRNWLNNDFYNQAFSDKEKESILTESIKNSRLSLQQFPELNDKSNISKISDGNLYNKNGDGTSYTLYWYSKTDSITYTNDNVFIPSYEELNKYFGVEGFDGDGITEWWQADYMIQNIYCDLINNKLTENEYISQVKNILKSYNMDDYNESLFDEYEKLKYLYLDDYSWANKTKVLRAKGTPYSGLNFKAIGRDFLLLNNETGGVPYWFRVESEYSIIDYESNTKANTNLVIDGEGKAYTYYDNIPTKVESNEIGVRPCIWVSFNNENNEDGHIVYPVDYSCYNEILKNLRDVNALIAHNEIIDVSQGEYLGYQIVDVDKNGVDELVLFRGYIDGNPYIYDIWTIKNGRMSKLSIDGFTYNFKTDYGKDYKEVYYALNNGDILNVSQYNMDSIPSYRILGIYKNKFTEKQKYFYYDYNNSWGFNDEDDKYQEISKAEGDNAINDNLSKISFLDAELKNGLIDSNDISVLGDNVHIEGADVYQNSDGSIQIGGKPQEGAKLIQGNDNNSDKLNYFEEELEQTIDFDKNTTIENEEIILNNADFEINKEIYAIGWDSVPNGYAIGLPLNDIGSDKYKKATEKNLGRYLYVIYRDNIVSSIFVNNVYDGSNIVFKVVDGVIGKKIVDEINNKHCEIKIVEGDLKRQRWKEIPNDNAEIEDDGHNIRPIIMINQKNYEVDEVTPKSIDKVLRDNGIIDNKSIFDDLIISDVEQSEFLDAGPGAIGEQITKKGIIKYKKLINGNIIKQEDLESCICEAFSNNLGLVYCILEINGVDEKLLSNSKEQIRFNQKLIDEYNNEENKGKCKFDSEGNLWIESWPYLGSGPGEGVTIKYANGNEEHYEYSGAASAYDGGGHIDIYATEINGVKKDIEVRNENIKDSDKEFVNKIYEMIEKFKGMEDKYVE